MKQFLGLLMGFVATMLASYFLHKAWIHSLEAPFHFQLSKVYVVVGVFTIFLCATLFFLQKQKKFKDQIGFFYLFSFVLKLLLISFLFQGSLLNPQTHSLTASTSFLYVILVGLIFEVVFLVQLLKKQP